MTLHIHARRTRLGNATIDHLNPYTAGWLFVYWGGGPAESRDAAYLNLRDSQLNFRFFVQCRDMCEVLGLQEKRGQQMNDSESQTQPRTVLAVLAVHDDAYPLQTRDH
jgi:hypothetical protein